MDRYKEVTSEGTYIAPSLRVWHVWALDNIGSREEVVPTKKGACLRPI